MNLPPLSDYNRCSCNRRFPPAHWNEANETYERHYHDKCVPCRRKAGELGKKECANSSVSKSNQ